MKVLLLYTTRENQTQKIMQHISAAFPADIRCDVIKLEHNTAINLSDYAAVLIGCSIRYGYYHKLMRQFIQNHYQPLNNMLTGFFGVNMVARKANKNTPETNLYTRKFLAKSPWQPTTAAVFAGALYYPQYNWLDRNMIRFIMWLGKGDTDTSKPIIEYTDWSKVNEFAQQFIQLVNEKESH